MPRDQKTRHHDYPTHIHAKNPCLDAYNAFDPRELSATISIIITNTQTCIFTDAEIADGELLNKQQTRTRTAKVLCFFYARQMLAVVYVKRN